MNQTRIFSIEQATSTQATLSVIWLVYLPQKAFRSTICGLFCRYPDQTPQRRGQSQKHLPLYVHV